MSAQSLYLEANPAGGFSQDIPSETDYPPIVADIQIGAGYDLLQDFSDDELSRIVILPTGSRLERGATYIDLHDPQLREFIALTSMEVGPNTLYVPKSAIDHVLWNRLRHAVNPA